MYLDTGTNSHGHQFLQFLKDNRALICNGRITPVLNDFTFCNFRGRSVPDYIYCPADDIILCKEMRVVKITDLINHFQLQVPSSIPDHSVLIGTFDISQRKEVPFSANRDLSSKAMSFNQVPAKKNVKKIDSSFLTSETMRQKVEETILRIENTIFDQHEINNVYLQIKGIFLEEMAKLPTTSKGCRRPKRKGHLFWNEELETLWRSRCSKERIFLNFFCRSRADKEYKSRLHIDYKASQTLFDKKFCFFKRQYQSLELQTLQENAVIKSNKCGST